MHNIAYFVERVEALGHKAGSPVHSALSDALVAMDQHNLTPDELEAVLDLISSSGRAEISQLPHTTEGSWVDFDYGNVRSGDYVKVRPDAYDSDTGAVHNGLVGVLLRVSNRRCTVRYLGRQATSPMQHPIDNLLSMNRRVY